MTISVGAWLFGVLQYPWVQFFALPLLAALVTILLRSLSRADKSTVFEFKLEDFLIGIGLGVTGLLTLTTTMLKVGKKYEAFQASIGQAQAIRDTAKLVTLQQQSADLFFFVFGLVGFLVFFLVTLIGMALIMSHHGWDAPNPPGSARVPRFRYVIGIDAVGLVLLSGSIFILGELQ